MPILEAPAGEYSSERSLSPEVLQVDAGDVLPNNVIEQPEINLGPEVRNFQEQLLHITPRRIQQIVVPRHNAGISLPEEDIPPFVHLLPANFIHQRTGPNLYEHLRRVTQRNDLQNVEAIRLVVISYSVSLSHLALFLPHLKHLDLSGSVLNSLRDLGCGLVALTHLNVTNCGLNSFDGIGSGTPTIRVLIADNNLIQRVEPLTELTSLEQLAVQHNNINDLGIITFLGMCPNLTELDLRGNPVCHLSLYRVTLLRFVPTLRLLDSLSLHEIPSQISIGMNAETTVDRSGSSTNSNISLLSNDFSDREVQAEMIVGTCEFSATDNNLFLQRPATAPQLNNTYLHIQPQRSASVSGPAQTDPILPQTTLSVLAGSVLNLVRQIRQGPQNRHGWLSSSSSSSLLSNKSSLSSAKSVSSHSYFE